MGVLRPAPCQGQAWGTGLLSQGVLAPRGLHSEGSCGWGEAERQSSRPCFLCSDRLPARPGVSWLPLVKPGPQAYSCPHSGRALAAPFGHIGGEPELQPSPFHSSCPGPPVHPPLSGGVLDHAPPRPDFFVACAFPRWSPMPPLQRSRTSSPRPVSPGPIRNALCDPSGQGLWGAPGPALLSPQLLQRCRHCGPGFSWLAWGRCPCVAIGRNALAGLSEGQHPASAWAVPGGVPEARASRPRPGAGDAGSLGSAMLRAVTPCSPHRSAVVPCPPVPPPGPQ